MISSVTNNNLSFIPFYASNSATKRFSHLNELKNNKTVTDENLEIAYRRCFQIATRHLYQPFIQSKGDVSVLVYNETDGFGDHNHGVAVTNQIVSDFPNIKASLYTFFAQKLETLPILAKPDERAECTFLLEYPTGNENQAPALKEKILNSACVLDISYDTQRTDLGLDAVRTGPLHTYIREYGSSCFARARDPARTLSMGLKGLEEGIFFKEIPKKPLFELEDPRIKNILFKTLEPSQESIDNYRHNHHLHLFYHKMDCFYQVSDLYIAAELHKNDEKTIDILMPSLSHEWLIKMNILDLEVLKKLGIGSLCIIGKTGEEVVKISETGKQIRIIHPGFLPKNDFYTLMTNCDEPFGCTGDQSFSDAVSNGTLLHYELRYVKRDFYLDLKKICEELDAPLVKSYLDAVQELFDARTEPLEKEQYDYSEYEKNFIKAMRAKIPTASQKIASLIQNEGFKAEWEKVVQYLRQNCDLKSNIQGIVARHLAFYHFPELGKIEEKFYTQFRTGQKSIEEVHNALAQAINKNVIK